MKEQRVVSISEILERAGNVKENINKITPEEKEKCDEIVRKYIGEVAQKNGFQLSIDVDKEYIHEWCFRRTVDSVNQNIIIREHPLEKGTLYLLCDGAAEPINASVLYNDTMEGFEKAVEELACYMETVGYNSLEQAVNIDDRVNSRDYEDLYRNYKRYAREFAVNNDITKDVSLYEKYELIENTLNKCHERSMSFNENRLDLIRTAAYWAEIALDIPDTEWKITDDKSDCYVERVQKGEEIGVLSIFRTIELLWEAGIDRGDISDQMSSIYTIQEFRDFEKEMRKKCQKN